MPLIVWNGNGMECNFLHTIKKILQQILRYYATAADLAGQSSTQVIIILNTDALSIALPS